MNLLRSTRGNQTPTDLEARSMMAELAAQRKKTTPGCEEDAGSSKSRSGRRGPGSGRGWRSPHAEAAGGEDEAMIAAMFPVSGPETEADAT